MGEILVSEVISKKKEKVLELSVLNNVASLSFMRVRFCLVQRETNVYLVTGNDKPDNLVNCTIRIEGCAQSRAGSCSCSC